MDLLKLARRGRVRWPFNLLGIFCFLKNVFTLYRWHLHIAEIRSQCESDNFQMYCDGSDRIPIPEHSFFLYPENLSRYRSHFNTRCKWANIHTRARNPPRFLKQYEGSNEGSVSLMLMEVKAANSPHFMEMSTVIYIWCVIFIWPKKKEMCSKLYSVDHDCTKPVQTHIKTQWS